MITKPFFSIVTCTLNSCQYIKRNIQSVLEQNFKNYEHIFIDGYSNDGTYEILKDYQNKNPVIVKIFRYKPQGIANAFNMGIKHSTGKYLNHLNSDDYFNNKNSLREAYNFLIYRNDLDWVYGKVDTVNEKGEDLGLFPKYKIFQTSSAKLLRLIDYIPHQAVFIKKEIFEKYGYFDENVKYLADYEYWLRISEKTKWIFFDRTISTFTARKKSVSLNKEHADELKQDTLLFHKKYSSRFEQIAFELINFSFLSEIYRSFKYHR